MLRVENLTKGFQAKEGAVRAVNNVSLEARTGDVVTLLGPSGCGKTTILRCVAGLEKPDAGTIEIGGELVFSQKARVNVPTHLRPIAMVFQSYAIWPHMTVSENVSYPLRVGKSRLAKSEIRERTMRALEQVRIPELADRSATALSGGQQQRVAVARALIREPKLLLLDEPLSNLDAKLREEMRLEFKELFTKQRLTALYVTHDLLEALVLSDRVVVMNRGAIAQSGNPREVYSHPQDKFIADFMGAGNVIDGVVSGIDAQRIRVTLGFGSIDCITGKSQFREGEQVSVAIRPEGVALSRSAGQYAVPCLVEADAFLGSSMEYLVSVASHRLRVRMPPTSETFYVGDRAYLIVYPDGCVVLKASAVQPALDQSVAHRAGHDLGGPLAGANVELN